jgi:hypothetical protein
MKNVIPRWMFASLLGLSSLSSCAPEVASAPLDPPSVGSVRSYRYSGPSGVSEVVREKSGDGRETLKGKTDIARAGSGGRTSLSETVELDATGRLRQAEIISSQPGARETRFTLDPSRGTVHIEHAGAAATEWHVPADAPWLYSPRSGGGGELIVTPVTAWIALQAATGAQVVRVLEPETQTSNLVTIDQISIPTERGTTIVIGNDGADADERFVKELRLLERSITLSRVAEFELGA